MTQVDCRGVPQLCPPKTFTCSVLQEILRESIGVTVPENIFEGLKLKLKPTGGLRYEGNTIVFDESQMCAFLEANCLTWSGPAPTPTPDPSPNPNPEPNPNPNPNPDPSPDPTPTDPSYSGTLSLTNNYLDFFIAPNRTASTERAFKYVVTVSSANFFANGGDHIVFAINPEGGQGSNNPHCGPIYRNGSNLYSLARGYIVFASGEVWAEHWNGTSAPGVVHVANFNRAANPTFTVVMYAGLRNGMWAETMFIEIYAGSATSGTPLTTASVPWGWDWTGNYGIAIGLIGSNFQGPVSPGCTEPVNPGPNAVLSYYNMHMEFLSWNEYFSFADGTLPKQQGECSFFLLVNNSTP